MITELLAGLGAAFLFILFSFLCAFILAYDYRKNDGENIHPGMSLILAICALACFILVVELSRVLKLYVITKEEYEQLQELEKSYSYYIGKEISEVSEI